jgi:uncharacterized lipoprotein YddW (UPF0748 family)
LFIKYFIEINQLELSTIHKKTFHTRRNDMKSTYESLIEKDKLLAKKPRLEKGANSGYKPLNYDKMKAMWISQFDFKAVYCDGNKQRSMKSYKELLGVALDNVVALGFNTVIVQMRPNADSFYPSEYYPW